MKSAANENSLVWITGAGGLIGHCLVQAAANLSLPWRPRGLTRQSLDLADFAAIEHAFHREKPAAIIHCAAISKSPACQANPALASRINVKATRVLAQLAAEIPFVFFSTDLVFDGKRGDYDESASVNPLSVYGETKAEAEKIVLSNFRHTVIRTSLNGGTSPTGDRGFNEETRLAWRQGKTLTLFTDEFRCPIPAVATARAVWDLLLGGNTGLFHVAGSERLSRWEIGRLLAGRWPALSPKVVPGSLKDYAGAPRPPDTSFNCAKAQAALSFPLPGLKQWLRENPGQEF